LLEGGEHQVGQQHETLALAQHLVDFHFGPVLPLLERFVALCVYLHTDVVGLLVVDDPFYFFGTFT